MSLVSRCGVLVVALAASVAALAAEKPGTSRSRFDSRAFDVFVEKTLRDWEVPGAAVAIVQGDKVIHLKGYGLRDVDTREPVTPETLFGIGGCAKAFINATVALLVDEGTMSWDDPVRKHIDFFRLSDPLADANVTLRDLLTHRTGLPDTPLFYSWSSFSQGEIARRFAQVKPAYSFRERFSLQHGLDRLAAYTVERTSGQPWEQFARRRIFEPLGMRDVAFGAAEAQKAPNHATPYTKKADKLAPAPWLTSQFGPHFATHVSVGGMARWVLLHLNEGQVEGRRLISERSMGEMHSPQGLGGHLKTGHSWTGQNRPFMGSVRDRI